MSLSVKEALTRFVAGRVAADEVVRVVTAAYYGAASGEGKGRARERLRPVMEVIERAAPGVVELASVRGGPGFEIRPSVRAFPTAEEPELRRAAEAWLSGAAEGATPPSADVPPSPQPQPAPSPSAPPLVALRPSVLYRVVTALRRLFTASA